MANQKLFQYSQASLQDFADCRRRFYYRYCSQQSWPAVITEPAVKAEKMARAGEQFHLLVKQYLNGVPADLLRGSISHHYELIGWWDSFLQTVILDEGAALYPEKVLSGAIGGHKLVAKFDLVALNPDGSVSIYDWKTGRKQPQRSVLAHRWQTIIYPYLLALSGAVVNSGNQISSEDIKMVYWYANHPEKPIVFRYSEADLKADEQAIQSLIDQIESLEEVEEFPMTDDDKKCAYCVFRSLCDRGVHAGEGLEEELDSRQITDFDFDQIQEIEF